MNTEVVMLHVRLDGGSERILKGRVAWTLDHLIKAGEKGVTPIGRPAPRWSDYVFKLRGQGIVVETIDEKHGGTYRGTHARYVLRSPLVVVEAVRAREAR